MVGYLSTHLTFTSKYVEFQEEVKKRVIKLSRCYKISHFQHDLVMGRVKSCYSMREFGNLCRILRPLQGYNRAFCRNVGISRISCTFPSQKSDDSTPPMPNFHASWITPKSRPLLTGCYTTWQNLAKPFKFCHFSPSFSIDDP